MNVPSHIRVYRAMNKLFHVRLYNHALNERVRFLVTGAGEHSAAKRALDSGLWGASGWSVTSVSFICMTNDDVLMEA